jgi:c-di-GMP-related signal transduction protein
VDIFVARQPILNTSQQVCAYELLYRNDNQNRFSNVEGEQATSDVINSVLQIGFEELSEGKPCFINFTEKLLENTTIPSFLQPEMMIIEVLETVNPTDKVIENCKTLKDQGYKIALDDFEMKLDNENFNKLLELADIVKIDIRKTSRLEQIKIFHALKSYNVIFLAEKVETREEYEQCLRDGYQFFQGYFFSKPVILSTSDVPFQNQNVAIIMNELSRRDLEIDIEYITKIIQSDVSLSYKLLKLINSPITGPVKQIKSIKHAIIFLGLKELRKWIYVLSFRENSFKTDPYTNEVIKMCFIRAKAGELIAQEIGKRKESSSYFLIGMLSLIDTLMKRPLHKVLDQLPLDNFVLETLLGYKTPYSDIVDLIIEVERADWFKIGKISKTVGISKHKLFHLYKESMKWAKEVMEESF